VADDALGTSEYDCSVSSRAGGKFGGGGAAAGEEWLAVRSDSGSEVKSSVLRYWLLRQQLEGEKNKTKGTGGFGLVTSMNSASSSASSLLPTLMLSETGLCFVRFLPLLLDASLGAARRIIGADMHSRRIVKLLLVAVVEVDIVRCLPHVALVYYTSWGIDGT